MQINLKLKKSNDQNILQICIASLHELTSAADEALDIKAGSFVWNFEFRTLEFVWDLVFGAWNFH